MKNKVLSLLFCSGQLAFGSGLFEGSASYGVGWYSYSEPGVMDISGAMNLLNVDFNINTPYVAQTLVGYGAIGMGMNYNGSLCKIGTQECVPHRVSSKDMYWGAEYKIGPRIQKDNFIFDLRAGVGYRFLSNTISGSGAYLREQSYVYMPIGLMVRHSIVDGFLMKYGFEYRMFFYGKNKSYMESVGLRTLTFEQNVGIGLRALFGVEKKIGDIGLFVQGVFDFWNIDNSNIQTAIKDGKPVSYIEPFNNTKLFSIEAGVSF